MPELSVLVTRPQGQGESLAAALELQGFHPVLQPLIDIEVFPEPSPRQRSCLLGLDRYQHVIFVSANAIRCGMDWIADYWPQLPVDIHWYTVGKASASLLQDYGVAVLQPDGEMSSEALLRLPELRAPAGQRILLVKGEGGRALIQERLEQRGATVDTLCCYRRRCPPLARGELAQLLRSRTFAALLISSGEGLDNLVSLLGDELWDTVQNVPLIVPGERVAEIARQQGFGPVVVAENATDGAMLEALLTIRRE